MSRAVLKYVRDARSLQVVIQGIDIRELRAIIVGLGLAVQLREPRSIDIEAELDEAGTAIASGIRRAFERGAAETLSEAEGGHLLS